MTKARLIKRNEAVEPPPTRKPQPLKRQAIKQTVNAVSEWIERKRVERIDPRTAFAALFSQSQAQ